MTHNRVIIRKGQLCKLDHLTKQFIPVMRSRLVGKGLTPLFQDNSKHEKSYNIEPDNKTAKEQVEEEEDIKEQIRENPKSKKSDAKKRNEILKLIKDSLVITKKKR